MSSKDPLKLLQKHPSLTAVWKGSTDICLSNRHRDTVQLQVIRAADLRQTDAVIAALCFSKDVNMNLSCCGA